MAWWHGVLNSVRKLAVPFWAWCFIDWIRDAVCVGFYTRQRVCSNETSQTVVTYVQDIWKQRTVCNKTIKRRKMLWQNNNEKMYTLYLGYRVVVVNNQYV